MYSTTLQPTKPCSQGFSRIYTPHIVAMSRSLGKFFLWLGYKTGTKQRGSYVWFWSSLWFGLSLCWLVLCVHSTNVYWGPAVGLTPLWVLWMWRGTRRSTCLPSWSLPFSMGDRWQIDGDKRWKKIEQARDDSHWGWGAVRWSANASCALLIMTEASQSAGRSAECRGHSMWKAWGSPLPRGTREEGGTTGVLGRSLKNFWVRWEAPGGFEYGRRLSYILKTTLWGGNGLWRKRGWEGKQGFPCDELTCCTAAPWGGGGHGPWEESTHRYFDVELTALDWLWNRRNGGGKLGTSPGFLLYLEGLILLAK